MSTGDQIKGEIRDQVGWITINRPKSCNAINKQMWDRIPELLEELKLNGARLVVFQGSGGAFAAGADLFELAELRDPTTAAAHWNSIRRALNLVASFELPTIAMVVGNCLGGGCLLASACDMRFAEPGARFSVPVAQLGIVLDRANIVRLLSLVGRGLAAEMLFSSAIISAQRAMENGLLNEVVPESELVGRVCKVAENVKANSAGSVKYLKQALYELSSQNAHFEDQSAVVDSYLSDDFRARVAKALGGK